MTRAWDEANFMRRLQDAKAFASCGTGHCDHVRTYYAAMWRRTKNIHYLHLHNAEYTQ